MSSPTSSVESLSNDFEIRTLNSTDIKKVYDLHVSILPVLLYSHLSPFLPTGIYSPDPIHLFLLSPTSLPPNTGLSPCAPTLKPRFPSCIYNRIHYHSKPRSPYPIKEILSTQCANPDPRCSPRISPKRHCTAARSRCCTIPPG